MIRDQRMQALVHKDKEPITPLVQRIRDLYADSGASVVLVMGGSGDFFGSADTVIMMDNYLVQDVTDEAKRLARKVALAPTRLPPIQQTQSRRVNPSCLSALYHRDKERIQAYGTRDLRYGREEIDVSRVEQLVDSGQLRAIGYLIRYYANRKSAETEDLIAGLHQVLIEVELQGLDCITPFIMGTLAMPRLQELAATVNRLRTLKLHDFKVKGLN